MTTRGTQGPMWAQKVTLLGVIAAIALILTACSGEESAQAEPADQRSGERETFTIAAGPWSSSEANANMVKVLLQEHLGYRVAIEYLPADQMWAAVATGEADATLSAWLPVTHADYAQEYLGVADDLGGNIGGVQTGLVVPKVSVGRQTDATGAEVIENIPVSSIPELTDHAGEFGGRIIGIEPSAGIMTSAREALAAYGLEEQYRLVEGSESEMIDALERAVRNQTWVVVTGWRPHWAFGQWNLAFLDDPRRVFGTSEAIHTVVRPGLAVDHPRAHEVLDRFQWDLEEIEQVMLWIERDNGIDPYEKTLRWAETHPERVQTWLAE